MITKTKIISYAIAFYVGLCSMPSFLEIDVESYYRKQNLSIRQDDKKEDKVVVKGIKKTRRKEE